MKDKKLTVKEQKFVDLVAKGTGKAEAAKQAGYSTRNAAVLASELQKKPNIVTALEERRAFFRSIADVEAKDIIGAQAEIAFATIEDALDDDGRLDFKKAKENGSTKLIKKISRQQTKYGETVAVEFYSRSDALGQLTDILGLKQNPRENADTLAKVLRSYSFWCERNPQATAVDKAEAIAIFAKGGNVDEKELAKQIGMDVINGMSQEC